MEQTILLNLFWRQTGDNEKIQRLSWYGEANPGAVALVRLVIEACKERGIETGICGQAPSNNPKFAKMLIREGIDSIGVTPDRFLATYRLVREAENLILSYKSSRRKINDNFEYQS